MPHTMLFAPPAAPVSSNPRAWGLRRVIQTVAAIALAASASVVSASGSTGCGKFCEGGFVRPVAGSTQGTCEGLCEPSACANAGNACVDNRCELQCTSLLDCASGQSCVPAKSDDAGAAITICQDNGKAAIGALCPFGNECATLTACPDGSACTTANCPATSCKPLVCLSSGSGDPNAFCTLQDCHADTDCPGGYWCETVRDPHQICGGPVPSTDCGTTKDPCVDPAMNTANGTTFAAGSVCTQRNECRLRRPCDPCATDIDCSLTPGQHCVAVGGTNVCSQDCASDADCVGGFECTAGQCVPRFGSCTGAGKFCQPCHDDGECATGSLCIALISGGERVCFQPAIPCPTSSNSACPAAPDGTHGQCLDATVNVAAGYSGYDTCYVPYIAATDAFGCWCGNKGTGCFTGADCCSKGCTGADPTNMVAGTCN